LTVEYKKSFNELSFISKLIYFTIYKKKLSFYILIYIFLFILIII